MAWWPWSTTSNTNEATQLQDVKTEKNQDTKMSAAEIIRTAAYKLFHQIKREHVNKIKAILEGKSTQEVHHILFAKIKTKEGNITVNHSPLSFACETSKRQVCESIFEFIQEENVFEYLDPNGTSAIHCAARNSSTEILDLMNEKGVIKNINIKSKRGNTPLHFACSAGNANVVDWLVQNGANFHIKNNKDELPLHWAASGGDVETFNIIFASYEQEHRSQIIGDRKFESDEKEEEFVQNQLKKDNINLGENCLKIEAQKLGVPLLFAAKEQKYDCVAAIFDKVKEADGTCRDDECDTALHFLSKGATTVQLAKVLKANALLGIKNVVGNMPLDWIKKETLSNLLDEHIKKIKLPINKVDVSKKDQYEILFTNLFGHHASGSDMKNILAIANSPAHEELALHPVCQSILSVKWQKMRKYFFMKLAFFIPLVILLSVYPVLTSERDSYGNDTSLLPGIERDIAITWYTIYFLLVTQVIFGSLSVLVLVGPFFKESKILISQHDKKLGLKRLFEYYITELQWSDWYEYVIWVLSFLLLHDAISPIPVVIVSWFSLFIVCSNHPSILPFRYILVKILFRYFKFLIFAFGLISGFGMGFYLLLRECKIVDGEPCADGAFSSIYSTALKVPAMMMGEISFETFALDRASPHLYFLFGVFIFLITCCLFNMMNGLAIDITHELMQKAHIFKTIAECEMIYEFEVLLKEVTGWLKWFGFNEINILSPLWVERLKASPSSGKCKNLDEYDSNIHGKVPNLIITEEDYWEPKRFSIPKWVWIDRGYSLDRKIIYEANALINDEKFEYIEPTDSDSQIDDDVDDFPNFVVNPVDEIGKFLSNSPLKSNVNTLAVKEIALGDTSSVDSDGEDGKLLS